MSPWLKQILGGLFLTLAGGAGIAWTWYTALYEGQYYPKVAALGPPFFVLGLALLCTPPGLLSVPDPSGSGKYKMTQVGWTVTFFALVLGFLHWGVFQFGWFLPG